MDRLAIDRDLIERIPSECATLPVTCGEIDRKVVFGRTNNRHILMMFGWQNGRRVHGAPIHVELIDGEFSIHYDGTEQGVAVDLLDAGIPKDRIVLAFRSPELRKHTGFAVA